MPVGRPGAGTPGVLGSVSSTRRCTESAPTAHDAGGAAAQTEPGDGRAVRSLARSMLICSNTCEQCLVF